jgi:F0F1-type ATP synthase membrane subunit a
VKRLRLIVYIVAALFVVGVGFFVFRGPEPEIVLPAEDIIDLGPFAITNTIISAWLTIIVLLVLGFLAGRRVQLIPRGVQNLVEAFFDFVYDAMENVAGPVVTKKIFPVVFTFFIYILVSNWMGLLPIFNTIGKSEDIGFEVNHEIHEVIEREEVGECAAEPEADGCLDGEAVFEESVDHHGSLVTDGSFFIISLSPKEFEIEIPGNTTAPDAIRVYLASVIDYDVFADSDDLPEEEFGRGEESKGEALDRPVIDSIMSELGDHPEPEEALLLLTERMEETGAEVKDDQKIVVLIPFFRSVMSDLNATIALGLIAFVFIESWGFSALGFSYSKKFINFSSPINFFVGMLEALSELIRVISFGFRLFGNIFAGEVLLIMMTFLVPFLFVSIFYGLELFVGFIQAAVFALLVTVFATMAMTPHEHEEEHGEHGDGGGHH